jgi:hypothetical protein
VVFSSAPLAPNASLQLLPKAGAQRTLEGVGCKPLFGWAGAPGALPAPLLRRDPFEQAQGGAGTCLYRPGQREAGLGK